MKKIAFFTLSIIALILNSCELEELPSTIDPISPNASFTFEVSDPNCSSNCEVTFTNTSENADSYEWDFGDGDNSTESNPSHVYSAAGSYDVVLKAFSNDQVHEIIETLILEGTSVEPPVAFTHTVTAFNSNDEKPTTIIDNPLINNRPELSLILSPAYNRQNFSQLETFYAGDTWRIYNQDNSPMLTNTKFNVLVGNPERTFTHIVESEGRDVTTLDYHLINNNPQALIFLTFNFGMSGPDNNHPVHLYYELGRWNIFNQSAAAMTKEAKFSVFVADKSMAFTHTVTEPSAITYIDNALCNNKPAAKLFVTESFTGGNFSKANPYVIGLIYNGGKWGIFNQGGEHIARDANFNVLVVN